MIGGCLTKSEDESETVSEADNYLQGRERHIAEEVKGRNVKARMYHKCFLGLLLFAAQIYGDCHIYSDNNLLVNGRTELVKGTADFVNKI